jgi:Zn-dependent M28 family amino/carboxypeptidase
MMLFLPRVDPAALRRSLHEIVGERSPVGDRHRLDAVESFIEREFKSFGLRVESDAFRHWGRSYRNVIGRAGPTGKAPVVVLGAHFDSVDGSPGADDNASGVAVLLEAARVLANARLKSEVLFCAFNLEELNMVGSSHFAGKLKAQRTKIRAMVSLEMVGFTDADPKGQKYPPGLGWFYPGRGDFIGVVGNWRSSVLVRHFSWHLRRVPGLPVETLTVLGNGFLLPHVRLSDHAPFWDLGYPGLLITDTAFFRNPHYHSPTDTLATLDLDFMAKVCHGVVLAVLGL